MARSRSASNVHAVLDYVVSKALLEGRIGRSTVSVPLVDLVNEGEGHRLSADGDDLVLKVEIKTSWDIGTEELETEFEEEPDRE